MRDDARECRAAPVADVADAAWVARLRWRCRRGLLENDLVLARWLDARGASMSAAEAAALDRALDLPDNELWDLIARRRDSDDPALAPIIDALRQA
ncbi:MAG TPA: succinate dehydrogenase assembly factor 2 [Casimicrobiaceae bacterium]|jgi:antitoxin CptB|nr:succinate dehydrogenase assembly factor 2 [Casimicrobiaceae bacterium]